MLWTWVVLCCVIQHIDTLIKASSFDTNEDPFINSILTQLDPQTEVPKQEYNFDIFRSLSRKSGSRSGFGKVPVRGVPLKNSKYSRRRIDLKSIKSSSHEMKLCLKYLTSLNRYDRHTKSKARQYIGNTFQSFNLKILKQKFRLPHVEDFGINVIGIRPGVVRKQTTRLINDSVIVIGAHFDTVNNTSGLNDNGSGVGVMLEMIRLLDYYQCETNFTIIFVAFDMEESGAIGSKYFVHEYLIPNELSNGNAKMEFQGAIILDTVMNYDAQQDTQDIPNDMHKNVPDFSESVKQNSYKGDFLAMFARTQADHQLSNSIHQTWQEYDLLRNASEQRNKSAWIQYNLKPVSINTLSGEKLDSYENLQSHVNMLRSDHVHFWYHNHTTYGNTLRAVLLTDTGPFRGYMRYCYHKMCDDTRFLTKKNIDFLKQTTEVLLQTVLKLTQGRCFAGDDRNVKRFTTRISDSKNPTNVTLKMICKDKQTVRRVRLLLEAVQEISYQSHVRSTSQSVNNVDPTSLSYSIVSSRERWLLQCLCQQTITAWIDLVWIIIISFKIN